jgi:hypothetical protein
MSRRNDPVGASSLTKKLPAEPNAEPQGESVFAST